MRIYKGHSTARKALCPVDSHVDKDGYYPHRRASSASCRGETKKGLPGKNRPGRQRDGYCHWRKPPAGTDDDDTYRPNTVPTRATKTVSVKGAPCRGETKKGLPCKNRPGRQGDGYCHWHEPPASADNGDTYRPNTVPTRATKTESVKGASCRGETKRGLPCKNRPRRKGDGYCRLHKPPAGTDNDDTYRPNAAPTRATKTESVKGESCRGETKKGRPCKNQPGRKGDGYCRHHKPPAGTDNDDTYRPNTVPTRATKTESVKGESCRGETKKGLPCKNRPGRKGNGYCRLHKPSSEANEDDDGTGRPNPAPARAIKPKAVQDASCRGTTKKGLPCKNLPGHDDCRYSHHGPIKCAGLKGDGQPCQKRIKRDGRLFCSYTHDPTYSEFYVKPSLFSHNTRSKVEKHPWDECDAYDPRKKLDRDRSHLDHVIEKQIFSAAFNDVLRHGKADKNDKALLRRLRELAVDREANLRFTLKETNCAKGAAVKEFLDDHIMGRPLRPGGLTGYLQSQTLSSEVTEEIKRVMKQTFQHTVRRLEEVSSELLAVADKLQNLAVAMKLS
ncbi:hypothetical protein DFJ73DRAFT_961551 [Zopfochytrium polystomum]|nr:hypothetical protein DFJ73DRAFT_961551 [Zopfochytrium polystomum]